MKECYIDMHCHILPGVDDGAKDLAETKKMLEIAYAEGIRCIIATPHHHPHRGKAPAEKLRERAKLVREAAHEIDEHFRVFCVGTDAHDTKHRPPKMKKAAAHVEKRYGEDYTRRIFYSNAKSMLKKRD